MRRYGHAKIPNQTYTDRPGVYGIILSDRGVLLTHQSRPYSELQLPGGGIDPSESLLMALHREVMEETGWRINPLRRLGVYQRYTYMPDYDMFARKVCHIFVARAVRRLGPPTEPHHTPHWVAPTLAVDCLASEGDAAFLQDFINS
jgi:8-oxo-dGTP diphosphatase